MYMDKHSLYILAFADIQKIHADVDMTIKQLIREVEQVTGRLSDKNPCRGCKMRGYGCDGCEEHALYIDSLEEKLTEYETAEEEGRLVVLPCKVGSVAYSICHRYTKCSKYGESFEEYSCSGCEELNCDSHKEYYIHVNQSVSVEWIIRNMQFGNFGKTVFLSREEAEKALKEMEGKQGE